MNDTAPLLHLVRLPLGLVAVRLNRRDMRLEARGGFEARWANEDEVEGTSVLSPETYRRIVKRHMRKVYLELNGQEPGAVTLNLASHQLLDDLEGWSRLNASS